MGNPDQGDDKDLDGQVLLSFLKAVSLVGR